MNIEFKKVNDGNKEAVLKLRVKDSQSGFIETTNECLLEAQEFDLWRPIAIYSDNSLIGFAMYGLWIYEGEHGRVWLDRFMIDESYQGKGYARPVLKALIEKISDEYSCNEIFLSLYENNKVACTIYEKLGFEFNGELDINNEKVMVLKIL